MRLVLQLAALLCDLRHYHLHHRLAAIQMSMMVMLMYQLPQYNIQTLIISNLPVSCALNYSYLSAFSTSVYLAFCDPIIFCTIL